MIIYCTTNLINNKKYIGQDYFNNPNYLGSGYLLKIAIKKYGKENFKKEILEICNSKEELNEKERFWINNFDAVNNKKFYNISEGGQGGWLGEKVNDKRKKSLIGHTISEEVRKKISSSHIGKKDSDETKLKKKNTHKNIPHDWLKKYQKKGGLNPRSFKVGQYDENQNLITIWDCQINASLKLNINKSSISSCINGKQKTAGGFIWKKML